jgi:uncharacterized protein YjiS (DUF1127 family)
MEESNVTPVFLDLDFDRDPRSSLDRRIVARWRTRSAGQRNFAATIGLWLARNRQRRHLRELAEWDDHLLKDIGVSREAALREAAKPFWRR